MSSLSRRRRRRFFGALAAGLLPSLSGCQLVFGDFSVETSKTTAPFGNACGPDAFRCVAEKLERCSDDRQSWVQVSSCADADHCDPTSAACRTCVPGQSACNEATLETCDANSHWVAASAACPSAALCTVSENRNAGGCGTPVCDTPGAHACDGNRLERCSPGRDALELIDRCGSVALCDPAKADAQAKSGGLATCTPPTCLTGTFACSGATLERCRDDETGWDAVTDCGDPSLCNPLAGACVPCSPGDSACSGSELWVCGANGFAKTATCAAPELCDAATGRCDPAECTTPGATRCNTTSDVTALEECGNDRRWTVREACSTGALCSESAGACLPPACGFGDVRCLGQVHQSCSGDLTHWVDDLTCPAGQACGPAGCEPPCTAGAYRCDGATLERCNGGVWEAQNRCATAALCDVAAHACQPPKCGGPALGDFRCPSAQNLQACSAGRDAWTDFFTCEPGQYCDADSAVVAGQPTCDACPALAYSCANGSELHLCTADGTSAPLVAECPGGCSVSADNVPSCAQMP